MTKRVARIITEAALATIAGIIGSQSAAEAALNDIAIRRQRGEKPICIQVGTTFLVGDEAALRNDFNMETEK